MTSPESSRHVLEAATAMTIETNGTVVVVTTCVTVNPHAGVDWVGALALLDLKYGHRVRRDLSGRPIALERVEDWQLPRISDSPDG